ncbi:MAG: hypothetical protein KatS3mg092_0488 [Patescibacteria group bacterium]|nr:MAG: hypothetical protein KatS3mg092_0488 [Patescibacteria group bacterium]
MIIQYPLPEEAELIVKKGDKIDFSTCLFENNQIEKIEINIAAKLSVNPKKIFHYLKKLVGEEIKKDDILAIKEGFFSSKKFLSPVDGIITEINHDQGSIIIKTNSDKKEKYLSIFKGTVDNIEKNFLKIKLNKGQSFSVKNKSDEFGGEIFIYNNQLFYNLKTEDVEEKIIISESLSSFEQIKLEALGVKSFVTLKSLPENTDLKSVLLKNIDDLKKITKEKFSYCSYIKNSDMIYFYD